MWESNSFVSGGSARPTEMAHIHSVALAELCLWLRRSPAVGVDCGASPPFRLQSDPQCRPARWAVLDVYPASSLCLMGHRGIPKEGKSRGANALRGLDALGELGRPTVGPLPEVGPSRIPQCRSNVPGSRQCVVHGPRNSFQVSAHSGPFRYAWPDLRYVRVALADPVPFSCGRIRGFT